MHGVPQMRECFIYHDVFGVNFLTFRALDTVR